MATPETKLIIHYPTTGPNQSLAREAMKQIAMSTGLAQID